MYLKKTFLLVTNKQKACTCIKQSTCISLLVITHSSFFNSQFYMQHYTTQYTLRHVTCTSVQVLATVCNALINHYSNTINTMHVHAHVFKSTCTHLHYNYIM